MTPREELKEAMQEGLREFWRPFDEKILAPGPPRKEYPDNIVDNLSDVSKHNFTSALGGVFLDKSNDEETTDMKMPTTLFGRPLIMTEKLIPVAEVTLVDLDKYFEIKDLSSKPMTLQDVADIVKNDTSGAFGLTYSKLEIDKASDEVRAWLNTYFCGCYNSGPPAKLLAELLECFSDETSMGPYIILECTKTFREKYTEAATIMILYFFNGTGIIEHSGSVGSSAWLTGLGTDLRDYIRNNPDWTETV